VRLRWESAYASAYLVQTSVDGTTWTTAVTAPATSALGTWAGMSEPAHAVDGDPGTAWRPGPDGRMVVDLGATRTVNTATLNWTGGPRPAAAITTSTDATSYIPFAAPATARYVAVAIPGWRSGDPELIELAVR
jgi:hypothetical protein